MLSEERVRRMTHLAMYDENKRKKQKEKKIVQYYKRDYIAMEMIKSFIYGTIAYILLVGMLAVYFVQNNVEWTNGIGTVGGMIVAVILYVAFMIFFLVLTYKIYSIRYTKEREQLKEYQKILREVVQLYEEEKNAKTPDEWREWNGEIN